ncbi:MAG: DUF2341 domain-containing protein, partial [Thermoplasmata archaeon]
MFNLITMNRKLSILICLLVLTSGFFVACSDSYLKTKKETISNEVRDSMQFRASSYSNTTSGLISIDLNNTRYVNVPKNGTVVEGKFNISTTDNFPRDVALDIGNNTGLGSGLDTGLEWKYSGNGYGAFGYQDEFSDNSTNKTFEIISSENVTSTLYLPKDASIINASATISGNEIFSNFSRKDETTSDFEKGNMTNLTSMNDKLNLTMIETSWNQTSEADFSSGIYDNVTLNDPSGDVKLAIKSNWLSKSWLYRIPITINNPNSQTLTHYQTRIVIDTQTLILNSRMRADCNDMRFTLSDGVTLLNHWIESGRNTSQTIVWVRIPNLANGNNMIYMYYGNPTAANTSNAASTFYLYEDFEGLNTWAYNETNGDFTRAIVTNTYKSPTHSHRLYFSNDNTPTDKYCEITKIITLPDTGQLCIIFNYYSTNNYGTGIVNKSVLLDSTLLWSEDTYTNKEAWHEQIVIATPSSTSVNLRLQLYNYYNGANGATNNYGCNWDDIIVRKYAAIEPLFSLGTPEGMYVEYGNFSSTISGNVTSAAVRFTTITWDASIIPSQSFILIQTRTGNSTNPDDGSWSGWSSPYTIPGSTITSPPAKYIQYFVRLITMDSTTTPVLRSIEIGFVRYKLSGTYISSVTNATVEGKIVSAKANVSMLLYQNTSVKISLSNDGGATWTTLNETMFTNFITNGT